MRFLFFNIIPIVIIRIIIIFAYLLNGTLSMEINDAKKVVINYFLYPESQFINK